MSIVLPGRKKADFLAPSKALQDAKEVLGPVYFDAKLVECPQNAVELSKLIKEWDEIDKQRFKAIEEVRRNQSVLLHTLNSRYTFSKSTPSLDSFSGIRDVKLPPPGFRFHANGKKKLVLADGNSSHKMKSLLNLDLNDEYEDELILEKTYINHSEVKPAVSCTVADSKSKRSDKDVAISDSFPSKIEIVTPVSEKVARKSMEKLKKEIEEVLVASEYCPTFVKTQTFLRAHSKQVVFEPTTGIMAENARPNDRFAFKPGSSTLAKTDKKINSLHKPKLQYPICSKCSACRYKLQHTGVEFQKLLENINNPKFRRWNLVPQGKITAFPNLSPRVSSNSRSFANHTSAGDASFKNVSKIKNERFSVSRTRTDKKPEREKSQERNFNVRNVASAYQRKMSGSIHGSTLSKPQNSSKRAVSAYSITGAPSSESSISFWKSVASDEGKECEEKVKDFLRRLKEAKGEKPQVKTAFYGLK